MEIPVLFGVSLTAAFVGGMVALFAPCCITFLFPSYLGTIFRERRRVVFLTLVFAAGLATMLVPVAVGMRVIVSFFDQFHTSVYLFGALLMFLLGLMTLLDVKLQLPLPHYAIPQHVTVLSTYFLGIFSGITSSCCAPVLFGALTLSSLSPNILSAVIVSLVYVAGITVPLFFLSLLYKRLTQARLAQVKTTLEKPLKLAAALIYMISAVLIAWAAVTGRITMEGNMAYGRELGRLVYSLSSQFSNPIADILTLVILIVSLVLLAKEVGREKEKHNNKDS